jgi:hypothetical protein
LLHHRVFYLFSFFFFLLFLFLLFLFLSSVNSFRARILFQHLGLFLMSESFYVVGSSELEFRSNNVYAMSYWPKSQGELRVSLSVVCLFVCLFVVQCCRLLLLFLFFFPFFFFLPFGSVYLVCLFVFSDSVCVCLFCLRVSLSVCFVFRIS